MEENNVGVADEFVVERQSSFLKGADFDGGLTLEIVKMEKFVPADKKYGVHNYLVDGAIKENWFIKSGLLKDGETFRYTFKSGDSEKTFDNCSLGFYFKFVEAELKAGDTVVIKRDKKGPTTVDWEITKQ